MKNVYIAIVAVSVIGSFRTSIGDESAISEFDLLTQPQKENLLEGIDMLVADSDAGPDARHAALVAKLAEDGWVYGDALDEASKTHPLLLPFEELPEAERVKEYLLHAVVRSMSTGELGSLGDNQPLTDSALILPAGKANAVVGHVMIKYIGKRDKHVDNLYGTQLQWKPGQSHYVQTGVANKMLQHEDTYALASGDEVNLEVAQAGEQGAQKNPVPLPNLEGMDKNDLIMFAQQHYGEALHPNMKEENMRARIHSFIESRGR